MDRWSLSHRLGCCGSSYTYRISRSGEYYGRHLRGQLGPRDSHTWHVGFDCRYVPDLRIGFEWRARLDGVVLGTHFSCKACSYPSYQGERGAIWAEGSVWTLGFRPDEYDK